jgi:anti-sigma B factor antagonist
MDANALRTMTSRCDDSVTVVVAGELDVATAGQLRSYALDALRGGARQFILVMTGVSFIDAAGLGTLVALALHAARQDTGFLLGDVSPSVARLLKLTGLNRAFSSVSDR